MASLGVQTSSSLFQRTTHPGISSLSRTSSSVFSVPLSYLGKSPQALALHCAAQKAGTVRIAAACRRSTHPHQAHVARGAIHEKADGSLQKTRKHQPVACSSSSTGEQVAEDPTPTTSSADVAEEALQVNERGIAEQEGSVRDGFWEWRGYNIRYQSAGSQGPPLLLIHGFGANCDHWRKNIGPLSDSHRVFAIDLLGYGYSSKPDPKTPDPNLPLSSPYKFETWGEQINDFIVDVIGEPAFVATNSVGGVAGLQAAVSNPELTRGIILLNISLRMLHISKQSWFARPAVSALQSVLRNTDLGKMFFKSVASPTAVANILKECYCDPETVTPELVECILKPGLEPGAVDVFLDFICYSGGPLPEDLIPRATCPVLIGWGEKDPWERLEWGRAYGEYETVEDFVVFPNVGHCPQDEAPHLINPFIAEFVQMHA